ncbi:MAG: bifunctional 4-hydroxy-2-oxoglutarate aldolase/2-dehydro-3-deoxy-phosphogluconate aldolase [Acidimicrobiia bacterium]
MTPADPLDVVDAQGVLPVLTVDRIDDAHRVAQAVREGGLRCIEVTFRTDAAPAATKAMVTEFPDMVVGAGTILSSAEAEQAVQSGAQFVVSPGFHPGVVEWCLANDTPVIPGAMTPTEVGGVISTGLTRVKFFPAEAAGGVRTLRALAGPFAAARFLPTGGIDQSNLATYLQEPAVFACGSSWVVDRRLVTEANFAAIRERCRIVVDLTRQVRSSQ